MPDIGKLLWPRSVAVVGASSNTHGLRGRVFEIIRSHAFAGELYPVSRSAAEVHGVKAYPSVDAPPQAAGFWEPFLDRGFSPDSGATSTRRRSRQTSPC